MARVVQIISVGEKGGHAALVSESWHAIIGYPEPSTACGVQLVGEDDVMPGEEKEGIVTCAVCRAVIEQYQKIKGWR